MHPLFRFMLIGLILILTSCQREEFSLYVFSVSKDPVSVVVGGEEKGTVTYGKGSEFKITKKADLEIILQQDGKALEAYHVGQPPLDVQEKEPFLYIAGGPASLLLANYTDFYGEAPQKPEIRDVISLRDKTFFRLPADSMLAFPSPTFPREMVEGKQMLRLVSVPPNVTEDKLLPFLYFELKQLK